MAWWSVAVLGGDMPLNILADIREKCGVNDQYFYEECFGEYPKIKTDVENSLEKLYFEYCPMSIVNTEDERTIVKVQILGVLHLLCGIPFKSESYKNMIMTACALDSWSLKDNKRGRYMAQLANIVKTYTGEVVYSVHDFYSTDTLTPIKIDRVMAEEWLPEYEEDVEKSVDL